MTTPVPVSLLWLVDQARLDSADIFGNPEARITGLSTHAQSTERNHLFVATVGVRTDSHMLISQAVERGASAVVVERHVPPYPGVTMLRVPDTRAALGPLAQAFYRHPARSMTVVATTGTNGKTSVTRLVQGIAQSAGRRAGFIGTLGARWGANAEDFGSTTPDALTLARILARMDNDGIELVAIETSSHAIHQHRLDGVPVHVGVLTNVTQDHLDYHGNMANYVAVKRRLFFDYVAETPGGVACLNVDDHVGEELAFNYHGAQITFSERNDIGANICAEDVRLRADGTDFTLVCEGRRAPVTSPLLGRFNLSNMLAAAAACRALGMNADQIAEGLKSTAPVEGRFERINEGQPFQVIVDYAHTPDALEKILRSVRQITAGQVLTVFGCGGERDRTKRGMMGERAGIHSDYVVVTSDNPRNEDPHRIAREVQAGVLRSGRRASQMQVILERRDAIERALHLAKPGDTVVIAGKGHEPYQEFCGTRIRFDDREIARELLHKMTANWTPVPGLDDSTTARTA